MGSRDLPTGRVIAMGKSTSIGGKQRPDRDYTRALSDLLPEIIEKKAKTVSEIADEAGRAEQTVSQLIRSLRDKGGKLHVKGWQRGITGGKITARYLWGPGEDAKRLKPLTRAEITKRYQKTDKGRAARQRFRSKCLGASKVIGSTINMNPLMSILYGAPA